MPMPDFVFYNKENSGLLPIYREITIWIRFAVMVHLHPH